jgi:hypothetical protein
MNDAIGSGFVRTAMVVLLAVASALSVGCPEVERFEGPIPSIRSDASYDVLFPYYIEVCAFSQIRMQSAEPGGAAGHGAMYVKGACLDPSSEFPTIRVCDDDVDLSDPESGVGVSVNKILRNVNWLATPGKRLFYDGNLDREDRLDEQSLVAAIEAAAAAGVFRGVSIHEENRPIDDTDEGWARVVAEHVVATDFALNFGRTAFCAKLPLGRRQLADITEYLNDLNRDYAYGGRDYDWSGYNDNCSHAIRNALAAAGVWSPKSVASYRLGQLANLSVPANEFADLALLITGNSVVDAEAILEDEVLRTTLARRNWLPARHGPLVELRPVHRNNHLYETEPVLFQLRNPFRRAKRDRVGDLFAKAEYTDLKANLEYFRAAYQQILDDRSRDSEVRPDDFAEERALAHFYRYVETQLADVKSKLARMSGDRSAAVGP